MSALMDDISRFIASPVSRRRAIRLVSGAVGGAVLASLGFAKASRALAAQGQYNGCSDGQIPCGSTCCYTYEMCCGGTCYGFEVDAAYVCCKTQLCRKRFEQCCDNHCCQESQSCCGLQCCGRGQSCCGNKCCEARTFCCGSTCCPLGYFCCAGKCVPSRPSHSEPCYRL
jgi:hypothetical protein